MRYFLTKGIILKKQPSGENDWFLTIFSPEYGKIQALSRSSRKISSHKGSHIDPLNLCSFQLYRNGSRLMVTECKVETAHIEIKSHLQKSLISFTILELLLRSIQEEQESTFLFQLTLNILEELSINSNQQSPWKNELLLEEFKIKLLKEAGSWPDISLCYFCQNKWDNQPFILCNSEGHLSCTNCQPHQNSRTSVTFNSIKLAKYLSEDQLRKLKLRLTEEDIFHLKNLTSIFLQNYFHQEIRSERITHA